MAASKGPDSNPYVGPLPFEREDEGRFFGRDKEVEDLFSLIFAHKALVLYAESGAGKSSLLNAGLTPRMQRQGFRVLPVARVRGAVPESVEISNVYVFNTLNSWIDDTVTLQYVASETLAGHLGVGARDPDELPSLKVVIFDQFEELFTFHPERWGERRAFFEQVREALDADPLLRVIFGMREDYIAQLDPYSSIFPERLRTRFRLERLRRDPALSAVTGPLKESGTTFAGGVAEALVDDLLKIRVEVGDQRSQEVEGQFVEPVQLQVVCESLWRAMPDSAGVITAQHREIFGDPSEALSRFYERSIKKACEKSGVGEGELRRWFGGVLITPAGTRGTVHRGAEETGGVSNLAVDALENAHLIRAEFRSGGRWYELNHDRFIGPIRASNQRWLLERGPAQETLERLTARAEKWAKDGDPALLDEGELSEAQRWWNSDTAEDVGKPDKIQALVNASRSAAEGRKRRFAVQAESARRFKRLSAMLAVAVAIALGALYYANSLREEANLHAAEAMRQSKAADRAADALAESNTQLAQARAEAKKAEALAAEAAARYARQAPSTLSAGTQSVVQTYQAQATAAKRAVSDGIVGFQYTSGRQQGTFRRVDDNTWEEQSGKAPAVVYKEVSRDENWITLRRVGEPVQLRMPIEGGVCEWRKSAKERWRDFTYKVEPFYTYDRAGRPLVLRR